MDLKMSNRLVLCLLTAMLAACNRSEKGDSDSAGKDGQAGIVEDEAQRRGEMWAILENELLELEEKIAGSREGISKIKKKKMRDHLAIRLARLDDAKHRISQGAAAMRQMMEPNFSEEFSRYRVSVDSLSHELDVLQKNLR